MIKQEKLPFQPDDFVELKMDNALQRRATISASRGNELSKQTDKFLATLGQGFGAAANIKGKGERNSIMSPRDGQQTKEKAPDYYEFRCKELQEEIDNMHNLINEEHGHDSVLANYIE